MKTLYLMRHGQTLFNQQHKIQGWCDSPLTTLGIEQAKIAGEYFKSHGITFDHAYASTLERASDTLELVTSMPYQRVKGLKEWNFGAFEGKDECLNPALPYKDFFVRYGGEDEKEFQSRVVDCLTSIMNQEDHSVVLAVAHGAVCGQFAKRWKEYEKAEYKTGVGNCAIFKYEYEYGIFSLVEIIKHDFSALEGMK